MLKWTVQQRRKSAADLSDDLLAFRASAGGTSSRRASDACVQPQVPREKVRLPYAVSSSAEPSKACTVSHDRRRSCDIGSAMRGEPLSNASWNPALPGGSTLPRMRGAVQRSHCQLPVAALSPPVCQSSESCGFRIRADSLDASENRSTNRRYADRHLSCIGRIRSYPPPSELDVKVSIDSTVERDGEGGSSIQHGRQRGSSPSLYQSCPDSIAVMCMAVAKSAVPKLARLRRLRPPPDSQESSCCSGQASEVRASTPDSGIGVQTSEPESPTSDEDASDKWSPRRVATTLVERCSSGQLSKDFIDEGMSITQASAFQTLNCGVRQEDNSLPSAGRCRSSSRETIESCTTTYERNEQLIKAVTEPRTNQTSILSPSSVAHCPTTGRSLVWEGRDSPRATYLRTSRRMSDFSGLCGPQLLTISETCSQRKFVSCSPS